MFRNPHAASRTGEKLEATASFSLRDAVLEENTCFKRYQPLVLASHVGKTGSNHSNGKPRVLPGSYNLGGLTGSEKSSWASPVRAMYWPSQTIIPIGSAHEAHERERVRRTKGFRIQMTYASSPCSGLRPKWKTKIGSRIQIVAQRGMWRSNQAAAGL